MNLTNTKAQNTAMEKIRPGIEISQGVRGPISLRARRAQILLKATMGTIPFMG